MEKHVVFKKSHRFRSGAVRGRALSAADMSMDEAIYPYLLVSVYDFISSFMATAVMCS
jgi:hypothetical protein